MTGGSLARHDGDVASSEYCFRRLVDVNHLQLTSDSVGRIQVVGADAQLDRDLEQREGLFELWHGYLGRLAAYASAWVSTHSGAYWIGEPYSSFGSVQTSQTQGARSLAHSPLALRW